MSGQTVVTLVVTPVSFGLILLLPSVVGVVSAHRGTGRFLWVMAATALALAVFGWLSLAQGRDIGGFSGVGYVLIGYLLWLVGLLVGIGVCVAELIRARRTRQLAWFATLLAFGAVPLVASLVVLTVTIAFLEQYYGRGLIVFQSQLLAFPLLPLAL